MGRSCKRRRGQRRPAGAAGGLALRVGASDLERPTKATARLRVTMQAVRNNANRAIWTRLGSSGQGGSQCRFATWSECGDFWLHRFA
ncbi:hypothetical protein XHV734_1398 [Xanthomonas hortorum pv. vitians]|nr:hypothetical protein XHV734_1398 [Xanthomonas hortorum pv. vitians]